MDNIKKTLLVAVLVLLIPLGYGEPDEFHGLSYGIYTVSCIPPNYHSANKALSSQQNIESSDVKEKQEIEAVYVGGRGILEMMIKDPDEVRALVLQQNTKSSNIKEEQVKDE